MPHTLRIDYTTNHGDPLIARCTEGDWSRLLPLTTVAGAPASQRSTREPLALTSYYHWCHQLDVLKAEGSY